MWDEAARQTGAPGGMVRDEVAALRGMVRDDDVRRHDVHKSYCRHIFIVLSVLQAYLHYILFRFFLYRSQNCNNSPRKKAESEDKTAMVSRRNGGKDTLIMRIAYHSKNFL